MAHQGPGTSYRVVRRLGRGGMGVVDLAVGPAGAEVALKRLSLHGTPDEITRARARLRREAEVLGSLRHPGIVRLLDLLDDGDDVVLVMPYLAGGSLHDRVAAAGPLAPDEVRALADRLLDALAAAHRQGVVHRDIKPENVLFTAAGDPQLVDFGVARATDQTPGLTATSMVVGTPAFMAPEQARGEPASAAADVFSLGATLLFALTGEGPFGPAAGDPRVLMHRAAQGRVGRPPRDLDPDLRALLTAALDRAPARRPSAARLRGGVGGTSPRTGLADAVRRNRVVAAAGVGAVAVLLAVGGVVAVVGGDDDGAAAERPGPASRAAPASTAPTTPPCTPQRYRPCGPAGLGAPAPGTDGDTCLPGFDDYDGDTGNGCEAGADDRPDGAVLADGAGALEATIVPRDDVDTFAVPVEDAFDLDCSGRLTLTLDGPEGMVLELRVARGAEVLATRVSEGGRPAVARLGERCGRDDTGELTVRVRPIGSDRVAGPYTLDRDGSF
ncbi:MAG TPA: serine/threonine-protein kinase [Acidimicrobiales bacterium]|nr:serine/threonine-protein kinase [Acidimicrobiales bacterium]